MHALSKTDLVNSIDALLPQTQCTKCGYDGCMPYAQAMADGLADVNRCPPGDQQGMLALAALLNREPKPIDPACGTPGPLMVAVIDPEHCIGCTLCIKACPVDAIIGANKHMHTVLSDWCTGCDLCIAPCPVDCISMQVVAPDTSTWDTQKANLARQRYQSTQARRHKKIAAQTNIKPPVPEADKASLIAAALAKARARRTGAA